MKQGFTLLELSIVLVIIGLIIGGITAGASLIRSAELNSVLKEKGNYLLAVSTFKLKYNALPGDMKNAELYWGTANAADASCITTKSTTQSTCNGNGDGILQYSSRSNEYFRFWQHLSNAQIIQGQFNGASRDSSNIFSSELGVNVPRSTVSGAGWMSIYLGKPSSSGDWLDGTYNNSLIFGSESPSSYTYLPILTPSEAMAIDIKSDDGNAGKGNIVAGRYTICTNASNSADINAEYLLSSSAIACSLVFRNFM